MDKAIVVMEYKYRYKFPTMTQFFCFRNESEGFPVS